jgi:hypothetical protein
VRRGSDPLDPYAAQDVGRLDVPDADHLVTEGEGLLDLLVQLRDRVVQDPELAVDAQEDLLRLPLLRLQDVDEAVGHAGGQGLRLGLLDDLLEDGLRELLELLLDLLLLLLGLLVVLLRLTVGLVLLAELLQQLLEGLLLAELVELRHHAGPRPSGGLLAERLLLERLLLSELLLLVGRCARELLALLLSQLAHLRGGAHAVSPSLNGDLP